MHTKDVLRHLCRTRRIEGGDAAERSESQRAFLSEYASQFLTVTLTSKLDSSTRTFHLLNAIQVKDTPRCKWRPSQRRRQYKTDVDFT